MSERAGERVNELLSEKKTAASQTRIENILRPGNTDSPTLASVGHIFFSSGLNHCKAARPAAVELFVAVFVTPPPSLCALSRRYLRELIDDRANRSEPDIRGPEHAAEFYGTVPN